MIDRRRIIDRTYKIIFSEHISVYVSKEKSESDKIEIETSCLSTEVPAYLRFNTVIFEYDSSQEFEWMKLYFTYSLTHKHLKNALIGSKFSITCRFYVDSFKSSSMFLEHFVNEVLPIINNDASQSYAFKMDVNDRLYYEFDVEEMITGIMFALPNNTSHLSFDFDLEKPRKWWYEGCLQEGGFKYVELPVNQISDWLTRKTHQQSGKTSMMKERSLSISINSCRVRNYTKLSKCVEKVAC